MIAETQAEQADLSLASGDTLKELIEKNIRWSQVIFTEQQRIRRRLAWMAIASWLRLFVILAPIILALVFYNEIIAYLLSRFSEFFPFAVSSGDSSNIFSFSDLLSQSGITQEQVAEALKAFRQ